MNTAATTPRCPNCGHPMKLARVTPRFGGLPELQTYECRPCCVTATEVNETLPERPGAAYRGF